MAARLLESFPSLAYRVGNELNYSSFSDKDVRTTPDLLTNHPYCEMIIEDGS
jgi:hypothetical protein